MIVTAALPWYNERPEDLVVCIRGIANVADRLIALDGAYHRYPAAKARSAKKQVDAIEDTAREVGLECYVVQVNRPWAGQVEKRSYLLSLATVNSDWVVTVDADHIIKTDRTAVRGSLENALGKNMDVFEVTYWTPSHPERSVRDSSAGVWHEEQADKRVSIPHIYRALPGLRVEKLHWWYSAVKDGQRVWLWSSSGAYPIIRHYALGIPYEVEHRTLLRSKEQMLASRAFLNDRELIVADTGQEDHLPGMKDPIYDYTRMPW